MQTRQPDGCWKYFLAPHTNGCGYSGIGRFPHAISAGWRIEARPGTLTAAVPPPVMLRSRTAERDDVSTHDAALCTRPIDTTHACIRFQRTGVRLLGMTTEEYLTLGICSLFTAYCGARISACGRAGAL